MAKITRIKANDYSSKTGDESKKTSSAKEKTVVAKKTDEKTTKKISKKELKKSEKKPMSKPVAIITWPLRMIFKPFKKLGRYFKESWGELRQVHWPNRASTWKMVFAVLVYSALFIAIITLLDTLLTFIFNKLLG